MAMVVALINTLKLFKISPKVAMMVQSQTYISAVRLLDYRFLGR